MASKKKRKVPPKKELSMTMKDAVIEAESITKPFEEESKKKRSYLIENATAIIAFLTVGLFIILYAFNTGYYGAFSIPVECISVDLKSYIPVAIQVIGLAMLIIRYISLVKTDVALKKNTINPMRILYGAIVLMSIITYNHYHILLDTIRINLPTVNKYIPVGMILVFAIPIAISVGVELYIYFLRKPRKNTKLNKQEYAMRMTDMVNDRFFYSYFYKGGLFIIVLAITIVPYLGKLSAKAKREYQIITVDDASYAVIFTEADRYLVQSATVQGEELTIDTSSFKYFDKDAGEVRYLQFDEVALEKTDNP